MKFSIITATRNNEATLSDTIESVLSQKNVEIEYIIVDGASSDGLMKDFYRLPQYEDFDINGYTFIKQYKHIYSHKKWIMDVYEYENGILPNDEYLVLKGLSDLKEIPIIGAHLKILKEKKIL